MTGIEDDNRRFGRSGLQNCKIIYRAQGMGSRLGLQHDELKAAQRIVYQYGQILSSPIEMFCPGHVHPHTAVNDRGLPGAEILSMLMQYTPDRTPAEWACQFPGFMSH